ncbi:hypothetical protein [Teichococcus aestuarii]|uniref:hypothetical protein n=1 Tax=Teichococcus aestuarii TaxID=568898 RepID=UPI0036207BD6
MTLRLDDDTLHLEGDCGSEEAEPLLSLLLERPSRGIALGRARTLHTALVQVLLALRPRLLEAPTDPFLRQWIAPVLEDGSSNGAPELIQSAPPARHEGL